MSLRLRNVDADLDAPVEQWPFEAVLAALERGGIAYWARLAAAIREEPWGPTARKVEQAVDVSHPYGVAPLMRHIVACARTERERLERERVAALVREAITRSGLSRAAFAERIGTSGSRLSTYATGRVTPSAAMLLRIQGVTRA